HTWTHSKDGAVPVDESAKKVEGLLRGYAIDWMIGIRTADGDGEYAGKEFKYELHSQPAESMHLTSEPGDPAWCPYAVMLYSAFDDMSGKLMSNFGLNPPEAPTSFTFVEATGRNGY